MSGSLAIATVTAVLKDMVQQSVSGANVQTDSPGSPSAGGGSQVNIFLYQVSQNPHWRNEDLPTRRADGSLAARPTVALDLHYLISFYGAEAELVPQRLMGQVMSAVHARPILDRHYIEEVVNNNLFLAGSRLAQQIETVKFSPMPLSLDELSKLWSVLFQTSYALSIAYQASIVFVEADEAGTSALPVRDYNLYVDPLARPIIEQVHVGTSANGPVLPDSTIIVRGRHLQGEITKVRVGSEERDASPATEDRLEVPLSAYAELRAGVQGVQIIHERLMGTPPVAHRGLESNAIPIVLRPKIREDASHAPHYDAARQQIAATVDPPVSTQQRVVALLNGLAGSQAYALDAAERNADAHAVHFPASRVRAGIYLLRVQVDGAESLVRVDGAGVYNQPELKIVPLIRDDGTVAPAYVAAAGSVSLEITPALAVGQQATLILLPVPSGAALRFDVPAPVEELDQIEVPTPGLASGEYSVRIEIDGAQSPEQAGDGPKVQVP